MTEYTMISTVPGEPWKEDKRFILYLDHTPTPGEMFHYDRDTYQVIGLRSDCVRKDSSVVVFRTYCFIQLIKKDVPSYGQEVHMKFDEAMEKYWKQ